MSKSTAEIRQAFLDFSIVRDTRLLPAAPVPNNDNSAVYQRRDEPVQDVFLGLDKRNYSAPQPHSVACVRAVNTTTRKRRLHRAPPYLLRNAG